MLVLILLVALVGRCAGSKKVSQPTPKMQFTATTIAESDGQTPDPSAVKGESAKIVTMLDGWYQEDFVDPKLYGDGSFADIKSHFNAEAQGQFAKDLDSLTIGEARNDVSRVTPDASHVDVTVFFQNGKTPRYAVAAVTFGATATLKVRDSLPLKIQQLATFHFERHPNGDWVVSYYTVHESQDSVQPTPSGSAT